MNAAPPGLSSLRIPRDEPASLPAGGHRRGWLIATTFAVVLVSTPISFVTESVILALFGGLIGCLMALPLNRIVTCTTNFSSFSELAFGFRVTPGILLTGLAVAAVMGLVGGFLPALKASRQPLATVLRAGGATRPHWAGGPHSAPVPHSAASGRCAPRTAVGPRPPSPPAQDSRTYAGSPGNRLQTRGAQPGECDETDRSLESCAYARDAGGGGGPRPGRGEHPQRD